MSAPYDYTQQFHPHHGQGPPGAPGAPDPYGPPQSSGPYAQPPPGTYPPPNPYPAPYGAPPPAYGGYPPPYGQSQQAPVYDEVRTIFITGFPADVKERELNNLLRFVSGYEASQMNWKNGQAQGFAIFSSGSLARSACDVITQLCFDESSILRCEMARKNMYIKEDPSIKRPRTSGAPYGGNSSAPSGPSYSARPSSSSYPPQGSGGGRDGPDNPPCNTLFIGNLADTVNEAELRGIFGGSPAFKFIKVVRGPRSTTCFVEYEDVASAQTMHAANQGVVVASSDKGPLRVQYAKNPYGKKRDMTGALIDTTPRDYPAPGTN